MPVTCIVVGCVSRYDRDKVWFYSVPTVLNHKFLTNKNDLSKKRRDLWLVAIKREDLTDSKIKYQRVCSRHFITGKPAPLEDETNPDWVPSQNMGHSSQNVGNDVGAVERKARLDKRKIKPTRSDEEFRFVDINDIKKRGEISTISLPSYPTELSSKAVGTQTELEKPIVKKFLDTCIQTDQLNMMDYIRNEILNVTLTLENNKYTLAEVQLYFNSDKKPSQQDNKENFIVIKPEETAATNVQLMQAFALRPGVRKIHNFIPMPKPTSTTDYRKKNCNPISMFYNVTGNQKCGDSLNSVNDGDVTKTVLDVDDPKITYPADQKLMTSYVRINDTLEIKQVDPSAREHDLVCVYCMTVFETGVELIEHFKEKLCRRKDEAPKSALCELCGVVVGYKRLRNHIINRHETKPLNYQCSDCGKRFAFHNAMKKHVLIHAMKRNFKCAQCPKNFKTRDGLRMHIYMCHTDPKYWKHVCIHCKKRFSLRSNMLKHERIHFKTKRYECEKCKKIMPSKRLLDEHVATCSERNTTATNEDDCSCSHCFESFSTERLLDEHVAECTKRITTTGTSADSDFENQIETVVEPDSDSETEYSVQKDDAISVEPGDARVETIQKSKRSGGILETILSGQKRLKEEPMVEVNITTEDIITSLKINNGPNFIVVEDISE